VTLFIRNLFPVTLDRIDEIVVVGVWDYALELIFPIEYHSKIVNLPQALVNSDKGQMERYHDSRDTRRRSKASLSKNLLCSFFNKMMMIFHHFVQAKANTSLRNMSTTY
jgi:hypothetical protein